MKNIKGQVNILKRFQALIYFLDISKHNNFTCVFMNYFPVKLLKLYGES